MGDFPVDMLHFDQCWPATGDDAAKIVEPASPAEPRSIRMRSHQRPDTDRWSSFGWTVKGERKSSRSSARRPNRSRKRKPIARPLAHNDVALAAAACSGGELVCQIGTRCSLCRAMSSSLRLKMTCGFPAPGSCRRSNVTGARGLAAHERIRRVLQEHARDGDALALTSRQFDAALADERIVSFSAARRCRRRRRS